MEDVERVGGFAEVAQEPVGAREVLLAIPEEGDDREPREEAAVIDACQSVDEPVGLRGLRYGSQDYPQDRP